MVGFMKKPEIQDVCEEETQARPGTQRYISGYQKALKTIVDGLTEEEEARFKALAKEWTDKSPPVEVQRK